MSRWSVLVAVSVVSCAASSGAPVPDEPTFDGDCSKVTAPTFADVEAGIFSHCVTCHASTRVGLARGGAPDGVNFDSYAAAKAVLAQAYSAVRQRVMPYPDPEILTERERNQLYEWALCGTLP